MRRQKTEALELFKQLPVGLGGQAFTGTVRKKLKRTIRSHRGVQLTNRTRSSISWIFERGLAPGLPLRVHFSEPFEVKNHFASN